VKTPVIMMTAYGTTDLAIEAMKRGAYDYLVKPFERRELSRITAEALDVNRRMKEIVRFPAADPSPPSLPDQKGLQIIGNSRIMRDVYKLIGQIAEKDVSCSDHRGERHRKGTGGQGHLPSQPAQRKTLYRRQLRGHSGDSF
jgi:two-component system, NtrC family, response regulator AtoC